MFNNEGIKCCFGSNGFDTHVYVRIEEFVRIFNFVNFIMNYLSDKIINYEKCFKS